MHEQLKIVNQGRKRLRTMSHKARTDALAKIRQGKLDEAEKLLTGYFNGSIESYALATDIVTNLVSYGGELFNFINYLDCQRGGGEPTQRLKKEKQEDLAKCFGLLERIATENSQAVPVSVRKGEATYALRELAEKFYLHYTRSDIQKLGNQFNKNNPNKEYSLASLTYTCNLEKEMVRVDFEQSRAA